MAKHYIIDRDKKGLLIELPTLEWAKKNPEYFKDTKYDNTESVNRILVHYHGFTLIANEDKVICFKLL
ncbi:hypothetical protein D3C86_1718270 [compost metagenome]